MQIDKETQVMIEEQKVALRTGIEKMKKTFQDSNMIPEVLATYLEPLALTAREFARIGDIEGLHIVQEGVDQIRRQPRVDDDLRTKLTVFNIKLALQEFNESIRQLNELNKPGVAAKQVLDQLDAIKKNIEENPYLGVYAFYKNIHEADDKAEITNLPPFMQREVLNAVQKEIQNSARETMSADITAFASTVGDKDETTSVYYQRKAQVLEDCRNGLEKSARSLTIDCASRLAQTFSLAKNSSTELYHKTVKDAEDIRKMCAYHPALAEYNDVKTALTMMIDKVYKAGMRADLGDDAQRVLSTIGRGFTMSYEGSREVNELAKSRFQELIYASQEQEANKVIREFRSVSLNLGAISSQVAERELMPWEDEYLADMHVEARDQAGQEQKEEKKTETKSLHERMQDASARAGAMKNERTKPEQPTHDTGDRMPWE